MFCLRHNFFLLLVTVAGVTICDGKKESSCRKGWIPVGPRCIMVGGLPVKRKQAVNFCKEVHPAGQLMSIHSEAENDILLQILVNSLRLTAWIGLEHRLSNYKFNWDDGSPVVYTNFKEKDYASSYYMGGNSVYMSLPFGKWRRDRNYHRHYPLCVAPALPEKTTEKCLGDYEKFTSRNNSCYLLVREKKTWQEAEDHCKSMNSHLVTVKNPDENNYIWLDRRLNTVTSLWIGLRSTEEEGFLAWSDRTPAFFWNWGDQEPFPIQEDRCIALSINVGKWFVAPCHDTKFFICKHNLEENIWKIGPQGNGRCPNNTWRDFGGNYCYYYGNQHKIKWQEAYEKCRKMNASLVSIHGATENRVLARPLDTTGSAWIGILDTFHSGAIWSDWTTLDYKQDFKEPERLETKTRCGTLDRNGTWMTIHCNEEKINEYICKIQKDEFSYSE